MPTQRESRCNVRVAKPPPNAVVNPLPLSSHSKSR